MTLAVGQQVPNLTLKTLTPDGIQDISMKELLGNKRVVLFAVPGAFTPTCSDVHLPGFVEKLGELKSKGVDTVACVAVNDPFVMSAWREARSIPEDVMLLSDGNGEFAEAIGLELDASRFGMGRRSRRFAAILKDGEVAYLGVEEGGEVGVSSAEAVLAEL